MSYSQEQVQEATKNCKILRGRGGAINAEAVINNPKCKKPKLVGGNCQSTNPTWKTPKKSSSCPMCKDIIYTCSDGYTLEGSCCVPEPVLEVEEVASGENEPVLRTESNKTLYIGVGVAVVVGIIGYLAFKK